MQARLNLICLEQDRKTKVCGPVYGLDGSFENTLMFVNWKCYHYGEQFPRVKPDITQKNIFVEDGRKIAVKNSKGDVRTVPLCNDCIKIYEGQNWLAVKK